MEIELLPLRALKELLRWLDVGTEDAIEEGEDACEHHVVRLLQFHMMHPMMCRGYEEPFDGSQSSGDVRVAEDNARTEDHQPDLHVLDIEHHEVESDAEDECDAKRLDDGGSRARIPIEVLDAVMDEVRLPQGSRMESPPMKHVVQQVTDEQASKEPQSPR